MSLDETKVIKWPGHCGRRFDERRECDAVDGGTCCGAEGTDDYVWNERNEVGGFEPGKHNNTTDYHDQSNRVKW